MIALKIAFTDQEENEKIKNKKSLADWLRAAFVKAITEVILR